jgi:uncharacterized protein (DUF924 family)
MTKEIERILEFWFGTFPVAGPVPPERLRFWFGGEAQTDRQISDLFRDDVRLAMSGEYDQWAQTPKGTLALIILLDQFPRNMYRHTPAAYASDAKAVALCLAGLTKGQDRDLSVLERAFFYLPLEHTENLELQERSVRVFSHLSVDCPEDLREHCRVFLDYAVRHRDIIARFGRFPHRNKTLGRSSTPEEEDFLKEPGSSF